MRKHGVDPWNPKANSVAFTKRADAARTKAKAAKKARKKSRKQK